MKNFNLFGGEDEILEGQKTFTQLSKYQKFKVRNHYRKADGSARCWNCEQYLKFNYHDKNYHKCRLIGVSNSEATDIRMNNVCLQHKYSQKFLEEMMEGLKR